MAAFGEVNSVKILLLGTGESEKWLNLSYLKKFCLWITNMNLEEKQEMIFWFSLWSMMFSLSFAFNLVTATCTCTNSTAGISNYFRNLALAFTVSFPVVTSLLTTN